MVTAVGAELEPVVPDEVAPDDDVAPVAADEAEPEEVVLPVVADAPDEVELAGVVVDGVVVVDAVVVVGVVVVAADAACAVGWPVLELALACVAVAVEPVVAAVLERTSATEAATVRLVVPRLPSAYTAAHMPTIRISASARTRRRRTFVRRSRARSLRARSGDWRASLEELVEFM